LGVFLCVTVSAYGFQDKKFELKKSTFTNALKNNQVKSLDDLVLSLPQAVYQNLTLSYTSGALLPAAPDDLRPVLWNESQDFVVTFNSHGNESVEALAWDGKKVSWELLELDLQTKVWKVNPPKCLTCHGPHSKPLWKEYPRWQGFIGSRNDKLKDAERSYLNDFLRDRRHSRLEPLKNYVRMQQDSVFPYRDFQVHLDHPKATQIHRRPNMRLGQWFARRNAQFLFTKLKKALSPRDYRKIFELIGVCSADRDHVQIEKLFSVAGVTRFDLDLGASAADAPSGDWEHLYFDGDAEVFEYLLWFYNKSEHPDTLKGIQTTLVEKYSLEHAANFEQKKLLEKMDGLAGWVELPFVDSLQNLKRKRHLVTTCKF